MSSSSAAPPEFAKILDSWHPVPETVQGELGLWPAEALAALLGGQAPELGADLPPLWYEVYLRRPHAVGELGPDGHPFADALVPPLAQRRRMFGGGRITIHQPLRLGETAARKSSVTAIRTRKGRSGWLLLVTELHEFSVDGVDRVSEERDIVYRLAADVSRHREAGSSFQAPAGQRVLTLAVDERLLFCFSALTYNAHRIHYDRRFTIDVEGHPDLLVHGPLLALGAIEAARRVVRRDISSVTYRLVSPCYPTSPVAFHALGTEVAATTVVGAQDGVAKVEAAVTWR